MDSNNNVDLENDNDFINNSDATSTENSDSSPTSSTSKKISFNEQDTKTQYSSLIKEVYADNLEEEMKNIKAALPPKGNNNTIGMDTEFPGIVYDIKNITNDFYYKSMEKNVNSLKLIQLGITIMNRNGEYSKNIPYHTWQFNFKFDIEKDKYSEESLNLLINSGINFDKLKKNGIEHEVFAQSLMSSGLVLNPKIKWVSFHGSYDFAYLLKLVTKEKLPSNEIGFINSLKLFFPNHYDLRMLLKDDEYYSHGGLNRLISTLGIERKGIKHQAGSDSIATIEAFFKLIENEIINQEKLKKWKNVLYGIGIGRDNENTIRYINTANKDININYINNDANLINRNESEKRKINKNMIYMQNQKQQINGCINNNYIKFYYPCYFINTYEIMKKNILMNQMKVSQPIMA